METKQTAVEWLRLKIKNKFEVYGDKDEFKEMFEQAKQMHKEQIIYSNESGFEDGVSFEKWGNPIFDSAEQYYNETYGK